MNRITAIIVDDHAVFRRTLRIFVQTLGGVDVVGEAADGQQALELTSKLRPQLVLMDICMPQMNGTDACRAMKRDDAAMSVVLYSADSLGIELAAAQGMADLCLLKECLFDKLSAWIRSTYSQQPICPDQLGNCSPLVTPWQQTFLCFIARSLT